MSDSDSDISLEIIEEPYPSDTKTTASSHISDKKRKQIDSDDEDDDGITIIESITPAPVSKPSDNNEASTVEEPEKPKSMRELAAEAAMRRLKKQKLDQQAQAQSQSKPVQGSSDIEKQPTSNNIDSLKSKTPIATLNSTLASPSLKQSQQEKPKPSSKPESKKYTSPVRLISAEDYCNDFQHGEGNKDALKMESLIGSRNLTKTYQFNFMIDVGFIDHFIQADPTKLELYVINSGLVDHLAVEQSHKSKYSHLKVVRMEDRLPKYGSHHTKMMVNFFDDETCQVVIHTMNMTWADYAMQTQMGWVSPRLVKLKNSADYSDYKRKNLHLVNDNGIIFKADLIHYLESYRKKPISETLVTISSNTLNSNQVNTQITHQQPNHNSDTVNSINYFKNTD
ncbi:unnamed protein product [Ambrosiozyma monospora]|uniref:Unnamed protein product n=1 Tax=Ambrosiozyma monospora TaxID=43982 RepID=A0ACB5TCV9_AMBMO|nr:unnamed protein product [Ambrosiozyma monospora]